MRTGGSRFIGLCKTNETKNLQKRQALPARPPPNKPSTNSGQGLRVPPGALITVRQDYTKITLSGPVRDHRILRGTNETLSGTVREKVSPDRDTAHNGVDVGPSFCYNFTVFKR